MLNPDAMNAHDISIKCDVCGDPILDGEKIFFHYINGRDVVICSACCGMTLNEIACEIPDLIETITPEKLYVMDNLTVEADAFSVE